MDRKSIGASKFRGDGRMKQVLFYDPCCPLEYDFKTLENEGLGGTEATILRVARLLKTNYRVTIAQRNRKVAVTHEGIDFVPLEWETDPDCVVTLRDPDAYVKMRHKYAHKLHYIWMHDLVTGDYKEFLVRHLMGLEDIRMLAVSSWHKGQIMREFFYSGQSLDVKVDVVYPPLADYCEYTTEYDPDQLMFNSSPHKGLAQVLDTFKLLRETEPMMRLVVTNPGYFKSATDAPPGVEILGTLTHRNVIAKLKNSLALFYPQNRFAETFGMVTAEANACGVPVICDRIGANLEVADHSAQFVDANSPNKVIERVKQWRSGMRPIVKKNPMCKDFNVFSSWRSLLKPLDS